MEFDKNYESMKKYWNDRISIIVNIGKLPNQQIINVYKAGFIYTHIIRDDIINSKGKVIKEIHVSENEYKKVFDYDTIGIASTLFTIGDFTYAKEYLENYHNHL